MATEWYYTINSQQAPTPVNAAQLKQLALSNQLQPTDLVWQEGMDNWMPASSIKGLFAGPGRSSQDQPVLGEGAVATMKARKPPSKRLQEEPPAEATPRPAGPGLLGMNPLLVLLLSVITVGIFGLVYVIAVCGSYAKKTTRQTDAAGKPLGRPHHPIGVLLLSYLTLGIYFPFWAYRLMRECAAYTDRADAAPPSELPLMLICPPYAVYVAVVRLPALIRAAQQQAKLAESPAVNQAHLFLNVLLLPALPFLAMIEQDAVNQVWLQAP